MSEAQEPQEIPDQFRIKPTSAGVSDEHTDIAITNLFRTHAEQVSSERAAIWQRYTAMLVGNSIISAFASGAASSPHKAILGSFFGILLCTLWYAITVDGWRIFRMRIDRALEFSWNFSDRINPFSITREYEAGMFGGWLYWFARAMIVLFGLLHVAILIQAFLKLL